MYLVVIKSHPTYAEIYWNIFPSPPLKPTPPIPQKLVAPFYFQKNMYRWNTLIITSRIICRWTTIKSIMGWATWAATDTSRVRWGFARMIWVWKVTKRSNLISKIFKSYIITLSCMLWQSPLSFKKPLTSCRNALCCCQPFWALESISFEKLQQPSDESNLVAVNKTPISTNTEVLSIDHFEYFDHLPASLQPEHLSPENLEERLDGAMPCHNYKVLVSQLLLLSFVLLFWTRKTALFSSFRTRVTLRRVVGKLMFLLKHLFFDLVGRYPEFDCLMLMRSAKIYFRQLKSW